MNSFYGLLFVGIFIIELSTNLVSSTECQDCTGCKTQISLNGATPACPDVCKSAGTTPGGEFVQRCSRAFFCSIDHCYCSKQACNGSAQIGNMPVIVLISFMSASFILKHIF